MSMDNHHYWTDRRVLAGMRRDPYKIVKDGRNTTVVQLNESFLEGLIEDGILPEDHDGEISGETKNAVCGTCDGSGTMVNPSIDAGGLSQEDFYDDPDFEENYFGGVYDQTCSECKGRRVVPAIKFDDPKIMEAIEEWWKDQADHAAEIAAERRMGA